MLLAVDIGNTHTVFGLYEAENLEASWRVSTRAAQTPDEWTAAMASFLAIRGVQREAVEGAILCSVVPPLTGIVVEMIRSFFRREPLEVGPGTKTGIKILYDNPLEVGADRIVNSVAALARIGGPAIVVDIGTATTFDALSGDAEYLGGIIVPGLGISADALFSRTAKLPRVEIRRPPRLIGRNTVNSIQSGLYYGYTSMIKGVLDLMKREMQGDPRVLATGGLCDRLAAGLEGVDLIEANLTLEGLRIVYGKNR